ncbi:MAG: phage holin family protein [Oscillospiraceae bacterium]|nr:phage holin family protein [Oscillospiraceae bacterium]
MNEKWMRLKAAITAAATAVTALLGWKGAMLLVWVGVMLLDYLSGTLAACREGQWSSAAARQGLWHKGGMILVVTAAAISDWVLLVWSQHMPLGIRWTGLILPLVLVWYILTELGSILENAVKMGARVPEFLRKLLKAGTALTDAAGAGIADELK